MGSFEEKNSFIVPSFWSAFFDQGLVEHRISTISWRLRRDQREEKNRQASYKGAHEMSLSQWYSCAFFEPVCLVSLAWNSR